MSEGFEKFKQIQYGGNKWNNYHEDDLECTYKAGYAEAIEAAIQITEKEIYATDVAYKLHAMKEKA